MSHKSNDSGGASCIYFLGLIGASVYFISLFCILDERCGFLKGLCPAGLLGIRGH